MAKSATVAVTKPAAAKPAKFAETDVVTLVAEKNPKRAASAKRFALYGAKPGDTITVAAYLDGCAKLHADEPRYRWRADLAWDVARGFITVAPKAE
jgi:hypothetical protein